MLRLWEYELGLLKPHTQSSVCWGPELQNSTHAPALLYADVLFMTVIVLHVGQCGNQIGFQFWRMLHEHWHKGGCRPNAFWGDYGKARAILVDTEPKVLSEVAGEDPRKSMFLEDNVLYEQCGRGNNWAMGYYGPRWTRKNKAKKGFNLHVAGGNAEPESSALVERVLHRVTREVPLLPYR